MIAVALLRAEDFNGILLVVSPVATCGQKHTEVAAPEQCSPAQASPLALVLNFEAILRIFTRAANYIALSDGGSTARCVCAVLGISGLLIGLIVS
jgi:hypothetical protein